MTVRRSLLSWAVAPHALSYDLYWGATKNLAADSALGTPINTTSTFLTIAASAELAAETLYYWRVDAKNEAGTTRGNVWSFTTGEAPVATRAAPGAAGSPQPRDGATGVTVDAPRLSWSAAPRGPATRCTGARGRASPRTWTGVRRSEPPTPP